VLAGNKSSFAFSNYVLLWSCFSTLQLFLKPGTKTNFEIEKTTSSGRSRGMIGLIAPLKPIKVTLFTMIWTIRKTTYQNQFWISLSSCSQCLVVCDTRPFCHPFFVTAVLLGILHLSCNSSKAVLRLDYQILQKSPLILLAGSSPVRCALTTTGPYFDKLVKQTQRQDSPWVCECGW